MSYVNPASRNGQNCQRPIRTLEKHHARLSDHDAKSRYCACDAPIAEAAKLMLRKRISGLPVVDVGRKLVGIVSEGDFIRRSEIGTQRKRSRLLNFFLGPGQTATDFVHEHGCRIAEIMTPDPVTISKDTPLEAIVALMEKNKLKRLPVMRGEIWSALYRVPICCGGRKPCA